MRGSRRREIEKAFLAETGRLPSKKVLKIMKRNPHMTAGEAIGSVLSRHGGDQEMVQDEGQVLTQEPARVQPEVEETPSLPPLPDGGLIV